jgi:phage tail-like protein
VGQVAFRKNMTILLLDEHESVIARYQVRHCWPSEYVAVDGLDANGDAVIIERLRLENEGWERAV